MTTSYTNYTGLRKGDSDFEGYISNGDINKNGLIDAYDISVVATQLEGGVDNRGTEKVDGTIEISTSKQVYDKDEIIEIQVKVLICVQSTHSVLLYLTINRIMSLSAWSCNT